MNTELPKVTRIYQNHHLDSTRWDMYVPREKDVIVTTSMKSGTTWVQMIVCQLLYGKEADHFSWFELTHWLDCRFSPRKESLSWLNDSERPRVIKTHLALDGLPYYPQSKYVIVGRDPRDVFMSWFNHYSNLTEFAFQLNNETPGLVGDKLPPCPKYIREAWRIWITKGWFDWESEGYPFWGNMHHSQTYWNFKYLPNFLFLHFNDLLKNLQYYIRKLADFLDVEVDDAEVSRIFDRTQLDVMRNKRRDEQRKFKPGTLFLKNGADTFFFKGSNGRWKDVLTKEDLELYEAAKKRVLTSECAEWLENGSLNHRASER